MNVQALARAVAEHTGIVVGATEDAVGRAVRRALHRHGDGDDLLERVVDEFTVKETWFFREDAALRAIDWHALYDRALLRGADAVHVWSAACSTGEEPYTLAMLACEVFGTSTPPVRILGTDVSQAALAAAAAGSYRARSVRAVPPDLLERWFDGEAVGEPLRRIVRFEPHNLVRDPAPGRFDVVLCRNVLIYFDAESATQIRAQLAAAVHEGGTVVLGAADALCGVAPPSVPVVREVARRPRRRVAPKPAPPPRVDDPVDLFLHGVGHLDRGSAVLAVEPLRRALYLDPSFALAAFHLGQAYDRIGDTTAAVRLYRQTLRTLDPDDPRNETLLSQVELGDVAVACRARIREREQG